MLHRRLSSIIGMFALLIMVAGCAADPQPTVANNGDPETGPINVSGDILIDGSTTVYPITYEIAADFNSLYPETHPVVEKTGTGAGFERFCAGETDISNASRAIHEDEAQTCAQNGVEYLEMVVGIDGVTVLVNTQNDFVECLSQSQLVQLFSANSTATTWADIDPTWPADTIKFIIPPVGRGTHDFMIEVMEQTDPSATGMREDENTTASEAYVDVLMPGIGSDPNAIGFVGYSVYLEAANRVRAVAIQNNEGDCVEPDSATIERGEYTPLSRPLYMYVSVNSLKLKPQLEEFVRYFNEKGITEVMTSVGYILPPEGTIEQNLNLIDAALLE